MGTILAARPSLPSSHPRGRLSRDRRLENSGYRPRSHCPVTCSARGCGRKEPRALQTAQGWGPGGKELPLLTGVPLQTEAPQATSFAGPLSLSVFFTKTGQAWAHELKEMGCGLGGPEMLPSLGTFWAWGERGLAAFCILFSPAPPSPTLHE